MMKAVIMAGGRGIRGRPYTEYFPKAMTPIGDSPLVSHIVRYVSSFEFIDEIIVIADLQGLGGQIQNYYVGGVCQTASCDTAVCNLTFVQDSQSGTGGDLLHASDLLRGEPFVLWFVDNLCAVDLAGMRRKFQELGSTACIATRSVRAEETGFASVGDGGIIREFIEKPVMRLPSSECLGVYILGPSILQEISRLMGPGNGRKREVNLSHDILQNLARDGVVSAFDIGDSQWVDVESPTILERNAARVEQIIREMTDR